MNIDKLNLIIKIINKTNTDLKSKRALQLLIKLNKISL